MFRIQQIIPTLIVDLQVGYVCGKDAPWALHGDKKSPCSSYCSKASGKCWTLLYSKKIWQRTLIWKFGQSWKFVELNSCSLTEHNVHWIFWLYGMQLVCLVIVMKDGGKCNSNWPWKTAERGMTASLELFRGHCISQLPPWWWMSCLTPSTKVKTANTKHTLLDIYPQTRQFFQGCATTQRWDTRNCQLLPLVEMVYL